MGNFYTRAAVSEFLKRMLHPYTTTVVYYHCLSQSEHIHIDSAIGASPCVSVNTYANHSVFQHRKAYSMLSATVGGGFCCYASHNHVSVLRTQYSVLIDEPMEVLK
jgi:hypothetical protein